MTITDVPDHRELSETGWLNLAWETVIDRVESYLEHLEHHELSNDSKPMPARKQKAYWYANRFKLNNAIALLQQALEMLLKARIAKVSPYLLLSGPSADRTAQ